MAVNVLTALLGLLKSAIAYDAGSFLPIFMPYGLSPYKSS